MMSFSYLNESAVILSLKEGNTEAFNYIYKKYNASLYRYALSIVKVPSIAEDIVQDVFLKIWEVRENINLSLSFQAYLYKISRNMVFKTVKKMANDRRRLDRVINEIIKEQDQDITSIIQWQHYSKWLKEAIDNLPPKRQKVFRLCREQGKTYQQAAEELGISRLTVKEHMMLAVRSIKQYLYQHGDIALMLLIVPHLI